MSEEKPSDGRITPEEWQAMSEGARTIVRRIAEFLGKSVEDLTMEDAARALDGGAFPEIPMVSESEGGAS